MLLMELHDINQSDLARQCGVKQPDIYRIMSGQTVNPRLCTLLALANYFGISINQLIGERPLSRGKPLDLDDLKTKMLSEIPIISWEKAGSWPETRENKDYLRQTKKVKTDVKGGKDTYALRMDDQSMYPVFDQGTILIIDAARKPKHHSYAVVQLEGGKRAVFRQILMDDEYHYLKPLHPNTEKYKLQVLKPGDQYRGVLIQAKMDYDLDQ